MGKAKYKVIMVNGKPIRRSRNIMQEHLGRELKSNEVVHHINGDKFDDRIENLQVMTNSEHLSMHRKKWFETHDNPMLGVRRFGEDAPFYDRNHNEETKILMSDKKRGSKNYNWIEGEVSSKVIVQRRYRAWKRIKNGRGDLADFMLMKETGGFRIM